MISKNLDTLKSQSMDFEGSEEDLKTIVTNLEYELKQCPDALGLSAIQVGIPERVAIVRVNHKIKFHGEVKEITKSYNLYNAKITKKSNPFVFKEEGCLSFPGKVYDTDRFNEIEVLNGDGEELKFSGFVAVVVQHELDHWDGVVVADRENNN